MKKITLGTLGAGMLVLTGCGAATYTQSDADALANRLREQKFVLAGAAKLDNQKVNKVNRKKIEVPIRVRGCILEIEQLHGDSDNRADEWLDAGGKEQTITDFPKQNPTPADVEKWADDHKQKLTHCYKAPIPGKK